MDKEIKEFGEAAEDFHSLMSHPGWKRLEQVVKTQLQTIDIQTVNLPANPNTGFAKARLDGQKEALRRIIEYPNMQVEGYKSLTKPEPSYMLPSLDMVESLTSTPSQAG